MAPRPQDTSGNGRYDAGSPLDGGTSPSDLGGGRMPYKPSSLEIGVITGICILVLLAVIGVFFWRARKNRLAKGSSALHSGPDTLRSDASPQPLSPHQPNEPVPPPKDSHFGAVKNEDPASFDQPISLTPNRGGEWSHWTPLHNEGTRRHVEEHEIVTRF
ncbi:hypothetical protein F5Y11DRAFT_360733 [Daldinia sp. FL1419]|nr:hypothetical protein F5Y11DRAFT_360733 [Daldinia sp. FL1419]